MNKKFLTLIFSLIILVSSCKKWLDVQPKTNISERILFENEQGFMDAMAGIYIQLSSPSLYAKEMTMAGIDVLAQQYDVGTASHGYYEMGRYNYENASVQARINAFWVNSYKAIANLNNLLAAIDSKKKLFSGNNYEIIKGEALALRAYLHFDLFRLFGPIPKQGLLDRSIPYVTTFNTKVKPNIPAIDFLDSCQKDLDLGIDLLSIRKTVVYGTSDPYFSHTRNHMNYWAANGLKARIALYKGDKTMAYQAAREVLDNANLFPFVKRSELISTAPNRTFLSEQLFGAYIPTLKDINDGLFKNIAAPNALTNKDIFITQLYEGSSTDFRAVFLWKTDGSNAQRYPVKYWEDDIQTNSLNTKRIALIRLSEIYYIAAEATIDRSEKSSLINIIRANRGIGLLGNNLSESQLNEEIFKEYRKEFYQEGQLFFYYKRNNSLRIPGYGQDMSSKEYVLPRPNDEVEFNNL